MIVSDLQRAKTEIANMQRIERKLASTLSTGEGSGIGHIGMGLSLEQNGGEA